MNAKQFGCVATRRHVLSDLHGCAELTGPEDTPYAGGVFLVEVSAPAR